MSILVFNAGSSTFKFSLFDIDGEIELCRGLIDWRGDTEKASLSFEAFPLAKTISDTRSVDYAGAVDWILQSLTSCGLKQQIVAVGHRVVHGGHEFSDSIAIDDSVRRRLDAITALSPLHNPHTLAVIDAARRKISEAVHVAVFDTTFFRNLPRRAALYPVPYQWHERFGIRRFGFHGLSHEYCSARVANLCGQNRESDFRQIICHLGSGASVAAIVDGKPIETTMGFTPLEGLMMGTRSGSIDPGILIHLIEQHGFNASELNNALNVNSGLLGVSGLSSDYRTIELVSNDPRSANHERAGLAIEMFVDRIRSAIASFAVQMGGADTLVFTAGIGQNSSSIRALVCEGLECLGIHLDPLANVAGPLDIDIATTESSAQIYIIQTREEKVIARAAMLQCQSS